MKIFVIFIVFFFPFIIVNAQNERKEIDSISRLIENNYMVGDSNPNLSLKHLTALYYASRQAGYYEGQVKAVFEEARIYYLNGNFDAALNKVNEGIDLAKGHDDNNMLCRILLIHQRVMLQLDHFNASKNMLAKAETYNTSISSKEDQKINNIYILVAKADLLVINEDHSKVDDAIRLKKIAYARSQSIPNSNKLKKATELFTLGSLTATLVAGQKIEEAKKYNLLTDHLLLTFPDDALTIQNLIIKGHIESAVKNYTKALEFYKLALERSKRNNNSYRQYEIYAMIAEAYAEINDFENSASFSKKYKHLLDSLDIVKKRSGDVNFINRINQKVSDTGDKRSFLEDRAFPITVAAIIFLLGMAIIYFRKQNKKKTLVESSTPENNAVPPNEMEPQETLQSDVQPDTVKTLVFLAKEDINTFYIEFQKTYPSFYLVLKDKYPDLNISDLNFCSLIKMNFSIKEIAQFTNSTIRAIEARRQRVYKKMDLKNQNDLYMLLSLIN